MPSEMLHGAVQLHVMANCYLCYIDAGVNSCVLLCVAEIPQHSSMKSRKDIKNHASFSSKRSHASLAGCLLLVKRIAVPCLPGLILESRIETMKFCAATAELTALQIAE